MRIHRYLWVVFGQCTATGKAIVIESTSSYREARAAFKTAETHYGAYDALRIEMFVRNPPHEERTKVQARTFKTITESYGFRVTPRIAQQRSGGTDG